MTDWVPYPLRFFFSQIRVYPFPFFSVLSLRRMVYASALSLKVSRREVSPLIISGKNDVGSSRIRLHCWRPPILTQMDDTD